MQLGTFVLVLGSVFVASSPLRCDAQSSVQVHPTAAAGIVFPLHGYEAYGVGLDLRVGADVTFDEERSQLLALDATWASTSVTGARVDIVVASAGWRWIPAPELGFYTVLTAGLGLGVDTLSLQVGDRAASHATSRLALTACGGVGWSLLEHLDVEVLWRHTALVGEVVDPLGTIGARIGGRL